VSSRGFAWVAVVAVAACSGGTLEPKPVASLASSTRAASAFDRIRDEWSHATDTDRQDLRRDLGAFITGFPSDGLAPLAQVYLVLSWMSPPQEWAKAEALLATMREPLPGTAHDLYLVAKGKDLRHHHDPDAAFDLLRPLVGKMVDGMARGLLEEEVALDALEAHRDYEAIAYMDAWIRGASEEGRDAVRTKVAKVLMQLPQQALAGSLRAMRASGASHGYGIEIQRLVAERLASIALEGGDPALARWLVDPDAGAPPIRGDVGVQLGELATSKRGLGTVEGRTVGLVLPTDSPDLRDEAADVARGMAWALDLPRKDPKAGDQVRLVTRDATGERERLLSSLEEIAGEGASIIVTGLDAVSADAAIEWAEKTKITLVVLSAPGTASTTRKPDGYTFVLGQPLKPVISALVEALVPAQAKRTSPVVPVVEGDSSKFFMDELGATSPGNSPLGATWRTPISCDVQSIKAGDPRFPVASWAAAGVHSWLLASSAECANDVIHEVSARGGTGVFALTLEAAGLTEHPGPGIRVLAASAGIVPFSAVSPADPRLVEALAMAGRFGGRPSFWAALGRDAGALARQALRTLPLDTVTVEADIARRRLAARDALLAARAPLWTTDADGFGTGAAPAAGSTHSLARTIRVVDLGK
jgi:hypothetical protein